MVIRCDAVFSYSRIPNLADITCLQESSLALVEPFEALERVTWGRGFLSVTGNGPGSLEEPVVGLGKVGGALDPVVNYQYFVAKCQDICLSTLM